MLKSIIVMIICGALIAPFFVSCDKAKTIMEPTSGDIVGTWKLTKLTIINSTTVEFNPADLGISVILKINSDNTYEWKWTESGKTETETGTWSTSENKINVTYPDGEKEQFEYTLEGNKLRFTVIEDDETTIQEYTRQ